MDHALPEAHGCGAAAKAAERKEWLASAARARESVGAGVALLRTGGAKGEHVRKALTNSLREKLAKDKESRTSAAAKKKGKK